MVKKAVNEGKNPADQPTGFGSMSGVPNLPAGFVQTFKSRFVNVDGLHLHVVIGGGGPPLLLGGWSQIWYSWRFVMPALAKDFTVIAVDPRCVGLSDKPAKGCDLATLARDIFGLMFDGSLTTPRRFPPETLSGCGHSEEALLSRTEWHSRGSTF